MSKVPEFDPLINIALKILKKFKYNDHVLDDKDYKKLEYVLTNLPEEDLNIIHNDRTILHNLATKPYPEFIDIMLKKENLDINNGNNNIFGTALHAACMLPDNYININLLLNHPKININAVDTNGFTPLHEACEAGDIENIRLLLNDKNIDANIRDKGGFTPFLLLCLLCNETEPIKYMLANPKVDVTARTTEENNCIHLAVLMDNRKKVLKLLTNDKRINKNLVNTEGQTPLDIAKRYQYNHYFDLLEL